MSVLYPKSQESTYAAALKGLSETGRLRHMLTLQGPQGPRITLDSREFLNFCSNDYLGLAADPRLEEAAVQALRDYGLGAGSSRLVCGNMAPHRRLEERLADVKGTEDCVVFSTGYMANVGILSALCGRQDLICSDRLNHASLIDGMILSRGRVHRYAHADMAALEHGLQSATSAGKRLIVTDTVFSMDGDVAPLDQIVDLARRYQAEVMVDEAHAFGVLGDNGTGAVEQFGVKAQVPIQMGTLSKAVGAFGAYCCGSRDLIAYLTNTARSLIYTTGLPPAVAAAALAGVNIIVAEPERRQRLWALTQFLLRELQRDGFDTLRSATPVIPVVVGEEAQVIALSRALLEHGIFVAAIRPPTVPQGSARLRVTVTAAHTRQDCERLLETLRKAAKDLCLSMVV